jgi:hypothetical protein
MSKFQPSRTRPRFWRILCYRKDQIDRTSVQSNVCGPLRNEERKNCSSCRIRKPDQWRYRHLPGWSSRSNYQEMKERTALKS